MPITQERLINLINVTERATTITRVHKQAAQKFLTQWNDIIAEKIELCRNGHEAREIIQNFLFSFANIIIDHQMSPEDYMIFKDEQIHFKYTQKRNNANKKYQQRHRARIRMRSDVRKEEILYAEEYAALNNVRVGNTESINDDDDQEINFINDDQNKSENIETPPTFSSIDLESDPDYDPSKRGEVIRDESGVGNKPIRSIVSKSENK